MLDVTATLETLTKAAQVFEDAVTRLVDEACVEDVVKKATEWKGTTGRWRRVGGFNLFLRDGDGVIMNGPRAFQGQPMKNISADDFKAIPHVASIYDKLGEEATPGKDITEVSSGVATATLTSDSGKASIKRGFHLVTAKLYSGSRGRSYNPTDSKTFRFSTKKDEVKSFEDAKAWARMRLREGAGSA